MKFRKYLQEQILSESRQEEIMAKTEEIVELVKRDCRPFLREFKEPVYRGTKHLIKDYKILTPRQDRRPRDTPEAWSEFADDYFKKKFGWRPRSQGVFTTFSRMSASAYGDVNAFFPIGPYKYVYSPEVSDFFASVVRKFGRLPDDPETLEKLVKLMDSYTDKNATPPSTHRNEIMFKCKKYYLVDSLYSEIMHDRGLLN